MMIIEKQSDLNVLAEALLEIIRERDYVSFVEIQRLMTDKMPTRGDYVMSLGVPEHNVVLWSGLSEELWQVMDHLLETKRMFLHPADILSYMVDGGVLELPLVKQNRAYAKPHWLPVCFRLVPLKKNRKQNRFARRSSVQKGS